MHPYVQDLRVAWGLMSERIARSERIRLLTAARANGSAPAPSGAVVSGASDVVELRLVGSTPASCDCTDDLLAG